jgi:hypothetical protein
LKSKKILGWFIKFKSGKDLLDHVEYCFVFVEPDVVVWNGHRLEGDLLRVFKERVRPPDEVEPLHRQQPIFSSHVVGQDETVVLPLLSKKDVRGIRLKQLHHLGSLTLLKITLSKNNKVDQKIIG